MVIEHSSSDHCCILCINVENFESTKAIITNSSQRKNMSFEILRIHEIDCLLLEWSHRSTMEVYNVNNKLLLERKVRQGRFSRDREREERLSLHVGRCACFEAADRACSPTLSWEWHRLRLCSRKIEKWTNKKKITQEQSSYVLDDHRRNFPIVLRLDFPWTFFEWNENRSGRDVDLLVDEIYLFGRLLACRVIVREQERIYDSIAVRLIPFSFDVSQRQCCQTIDFVF